MDVLNTAAAPDASQDEPQAFFVLPRSMLDEEGTVRFQQFLQGEAQAAEGTDLFKIPEDLPPAWKAFFEKVAAYWARSCAKSEDEVVHLKKRIFVMREQSLSEFEMLSCSSAFITEANEAFKEGNFTEALALYTEAVLLFPTPDAMNNAAACALKLKKYRLAEHWATAALEYRMLSRSKAAKAHYRRASARLHRGKFKGALHDAKIVQRLNPSDESVDGYIARIRDTMQAVNSPRRLAKYRSRQPKPEGEVAVQSQQVFAKHSRLSEARLLVVLQQVPPPVF